MAKCIIYKSNDVILRMSDYDAASIVKSGAAAYTSKGAWKAYIGLEGRKQHQATVLMSRASKDRRTPREKKRVRTPRNMTPWYQRRVA